MESFHTSSIRFVTVLLAAVIIASGCSGSSPSSAPLPENMSGGNVVANDDNVNGTTDADGSTDVSAVVEDGTTDSESDTTGADPVVQNTTHVEFEITVPVISSDELQVKLIWGSKNLTGTWVGGQFWKISDDFPSNAELPLKVMFYDGNGDIALASYNRKFRTGTNASEIYVITADEFDTDRWDEDADGVSNIAELIAGSDPLIDESVALEVRDIRYTNVPKVTLLEISGAFEATLPSNRPYFMQAEVDEPLKDGQPFAIKRSELIDIDASGNGSYSFVEALSRSGEFIEVKNVATRTQIGNAVTWQGNDYWYDYSPHRGEDIDFTIVSTVVDAETRTQTGSISKRTIGGWEDSYDFTYELSGKIEANSSRCEPLAGTITRPGEFELSTGEVEVITVASKEIEDQYWNVTVTTLDGYLVDEYLILSLELTFYCDYQL